VNAQFLDPEKLLPKKHAIGEEMYIPLCLLKILCIRERDMILKGSGPFIASKEDRIQSNMRLGQNLPHSYSWVLFFVWITFRFIALH